MNIELLETKTVITTEAGETTEICTPEELDRNLSDFLYTDFQHNHEHYYAVAINHLDMEILKTSVEVFKTNQE